MNLAAFADALRRHPRVQDVVLASEHLQIRLDAGQLIATASAPGWLALYALRAPSVTAEQCGLLLRHSEVDGRRHAVVIGGRVLYRSVAQGPADAQAALDALLGIEAPPGATDAASVIAGCRYHAEPAAGVGGWMLTDPAKPGARGLVALEGEGGLRVYRALHQVDQIADAFAAELVARSDDLVVGRLALVSGLGLVVLAVLPLSTPQALSDALDQVCADAQQAAEGLSDPAALLALLRSWFGARPIEDAVLAAGVLASAAGQPLPAPLQDPVASQSTVALAEILLQTIPALAPSGRLVIQIGLTRAATGQRPLDEVWDVAQEYLAAATVPTK